MTILRSDLDQAARLERQIEEINYAITVLATPSPVITVEISAGGAAGVRIPLPVSAANLTTLLNSRLTLLQSQLTALGA